MFDFLNSGHLEKLKVQSWTTQERSGDPDKVFEAFINPDEFTINYNVMADNTPTTGKNGSTQNFLGTQPLGLSLKFYLDGTGATGTALDVGEKIRNFYEAVGYDGTEHRTRYLRIYWGKLTLLRANHFALDCVLQSASLQYKLFKNDGTPLRVIITATFSEALGNEQNAAEFPAESPDLTHVRVVREGDSLPGMTAKIYGDFRYYLEVAKANQLSDFRNIQPGQKIFFPPFDKKVKPKANA